MISEWVSTHKYTYVFLRSFQRYLSVGIIMVWYTQLSEQDSSGSELWELHLVPHWLKMSQGDVCSFSDWWVNAYTRITMSNQNNTCTKNKTWRPANKIFPSLNFRKRLAIHRSKWAGNYSFSSATEELSSAYNFLKIIDSFCLHLHCRRTRQERNPKPAWRR